jgi:hypothetical protein
MPDRAALASQSTPLKKALIVRSSARNHVADLQNCILGTCHHKILPHDFCSADLNGLKLEFSTSTFRGWWERKAMTARRYFEAQIACVLEKSETFLAVMKRASIRI